eukprot:scaffold104843_cov31-Tisochrysis_lutea.AAC.2
MSSKLGPHPYARFSPSPTCAEQPLCSANRTQETSAYGASLYSATAFLMRLSLDTVSARRSGSARHSSLLQPDACAYDHADFQQSARCRPVLCNSFVAIAPLAFYRLKRCASAFAALFNSASLISI